MGKAGQDEPFEDTDTDFSTQTINGSIPVSYSYSISQMLSLFCQICRILPLHVVLINMA